MKIKLKTQYWQTIKSNEEWKAEIDKWIYRFLWIIMGHLIIAIYNNIPLQAIIDTVFLLLGFLMQASYKKYKRERI